MSILNDAVNAGITDVEVNRVLRTMAEKEIKRIRASAVIGNVMAEVEKMDKNCKKVFMNAEDYAVLKKHLGFDMDIETQGAALRDGKLATYCGAEIRVSRAFLNPVGVPEMPVEAEGCLQVILEEAV